MVKGDFDSSYSGLNKTSLRSTSCLSSLGTSIPIVSLPSITSTILTLVLERDLAKSLLILEIWLTFNPLGNFNSSLMTTGPGWIDSTLTSLIPYSDNLLTTSSPKC